MMGTEQSGSAQAIQSDSRARLEARLDRDGHDALAHQEDAIAHMREVAWGLIAGGLAPVAGLLVLDWTGTAIMTCVLINVCLAQLDRAATFGLHLSDHAQEIRYRRVWQTCEYLKGWRRLPVTGLFEPTGEDWTMNASGHLVVAALAVLMSGAAVPPLLMSEYGSASLGEILLGCGVSFFCYFLLRLLRRSGGRQQAGFALDNVPEQYFGWLVGFIALLAIVQDGPPSTPSDYRGLGVSLAILCILFGAYRLLCVGRRQRLADWLEHHLAERD